VAALILLLPFVAMKFTSEVNWTASDFIVAGVMISGVGLLFELAVRTNSNRAYRAGAALALAASFLTIWAVGAVGMIGDENNPLNLMFGVVLLVALLGAIIAGFRAAGMARAMVAAAVAQAIASGIGLFADPLGGVLSLAFATIWLASAAMFRRAASDLYRA
jgi:hypothetical protein